MPKISQQHRDARRDQILAAARRCFLRDGFHSTSMQDLFAEAGLSSGAVYSYFASKDDVIVAVAEESMRDVVEMFHAIAGQRPGRPVGAAMAEAMELVRAKDTRDGFGKLAVLVWSEALRNPELAAKFAALVAEVRADLTEVVRDQQGSGKLPGDVPASALADALVCMLPGYVLQLAVFGAPAVDAVPGAVRALWPLSVQPGPGARPEEH